VLKLGLIGCGGMGRRHVRGLHKLRVIDNQQFHLAGVSDVMPANAGLTADLAEELLGSIPATFASLEAMHSELGGLDAVIVTTAPDTHAAIGVEAFSLDINVMVEKPIALTVRQGRTLLEAAERSGNVLAVAENYRRDPINRLAQAVLASGALGRTYLAVQSSSGSGEKVIIMPWRHQRRSGGIVVDMGIHYADLLEYFLGPIERVFGFSATVDSQRVDESGQWHDADAEDLSAGVVQFQNGAIGNWLIDLAGRGQGHFIRAVYGTAGTLSIPIDRSGRPLEVTLRRSGRDERLTSDEVLGLVSDYCLDETTARLFGGERVPTYDLPFADVDANLLAIEQDDFARAILDGRPPEVDGAFGLRSLAIAYGFIEAERLGRAVEIDALLAGSDSPYQDEIDAELSGA
jgi:predicted dehydrogenase